MKQRGIGFFFGRPELVAVDLRCLDPQCPQTLPW
jgi:hypothetical protein